MTKEIITVKIEIEGENDNIEESSEFTTLEEIREKQSMVNIDFTRDNYLPRLNKEDLRELNKEDKPVVASKRMLDRNKMAHPDINEVEYNVLLINALYTPQYILPANPDKPYYFHFIANIENNKNSGVIVELSETKENYEIVHIQKLRNKSVERIRKRDDKNYKE